MMRHDLFPDVHYAPLAEGREADAQAFQHSSDALLWYILRH